MPGYDVGVWFGVLTVAGTPPEIVKRLNTEMVKILNSPEVKERFGKLGVDVVAGTPEQFARLPQAEVARWAKVDQRRRHQGRLMARKPAIKSDLAWSTLDRIVVRGKDLPGEILGHLNLGDMAFLELTGRVPNAKESKLFNAMVVTLVEHGVTPSALAARLTYLGAPEALQAAVAGGPARPGQRVRRLDGRRGAASCLTRSPTARTSKQLLAENKRMPGPRPPDPQAGRSAHACACSRSRARPASTASTAS